MQYKFHLADFTSLLYYFIKNFNGMQLFFSRFYNLMP